MNEYFFRTQELTVGYHGKPLIRNIEIRLNRGEILTLIGPNGSGKSTILKSITRHLTQLYGTVYIGSDPVGGMGNHDLARKLAVVLTERPKTELLTCRDVVAGGRYPHTGWLGTLSEGDRIRVREAMNLVHIWDLRDQDFSCVSDGQRQRVLLARALCQEPQIIVLDEPTSFLDVRYELEFLSILRRLAKERHIAVILSLHRLDMAQKISDSVMCVKGEYITHYGTPHEIFQRERIHQLYELTGGSYNPLFGSLEMPPPAGTPKLFVIAGGGCGIPEYRKLQRRGLPFLTGILHENDVDFQVARDLAAEVISQKSFEEISEETYQRAKSRLAHCEAVINCLQEYGPLNEMNRLLSHQAALLGLPILASSDLLPE